MTQSLRSSKKKGGATIEEVAHEYWVWGRGGQIISFLTLDMPGGEVTRGGTLFKLQKCSHSAGGGR